MEPTTFIYGIKKLKPVNVLLLFQEFKLLVWPGYITVVDVFEGGLYLQVDVANRVLRTETVRDVFMKLKKGGGANFKGQAQDMFSRIFRILIVIDDFFFLPIIGKYLVREINSLICFPQFTKFGVLIILMMHFDAPSRFRKGWIISIQKKY